MPDYIEKKSNPDLMKRKLGDSFPEININLPLPAELLKRLVGVEFILNPRPLKKTATVTAEKDLHQLITTATKKESLTLSEQELQALYIFVITKYLMHQSWFLLQNKTLTQSLISIIIKRDKGNLAVSYNQKERNIGGHSETNLTGLKTLYKIKCTVAITKDGILLFENQNTETIYIKPNMVEQLPKLTEISADSAETSLTDEVRALPTTSTSRVTTQEKQDDTSRVTPTTGSRTVVYHDKPTIGEGGTNDSPNTTPLRQIRVIFPDNETPTDEQADKPEDTQPPKIVFDDVAPQQSTSPPTPPLTPLKPIVIKATLTGAEDKAKIESADSSEITSTGGSDTPPKSKMSLAAPTPPVTPLPSTSSHGKSPSLSVSSGSNYDTEVKKSDSDSDLNQSRSTTSTFNPSPSPTATTVSSSMVSLSSDIKPEIKEVKLERELSSMTQEQIFALHRRNLLAIIVNAPLSASQKEACEKLEDALNALNAEQTSQSMPLLSKVIKHANTAILEPTDAANLEEAEKLVAPLNRERYCKIALALTAIIAGAAITLISTAIAIASFGAGNLLGAVGIEVGTSMLTKAISITCGLIGLGLVLGGTRLFAQPPLYVVVNTSNEITHNARFVLS